MAAGMATSGAVTDWLRQLFQGSFDSLVSTAGSVPAGSRGLLMPAYFADERTPIFDPNARRIIAGLTLSHGQAESYRAALEGTPQQPPTETIGAWYGSARLAASATGLPVDDWNPIARTVVPDSARTATYAEFDRHYRSLYPATRDLAHFLAAQQHRG
ncbi:MAG: FGGY-family carbohydrate kinase [Kibdelosporangium sp.]